MILTCQLMIILDASVVITALPKIRESLHFSPTSLSWVQNAYTLTFGGLLLLGARIGDIFGRRRVFMWGIGVFTAASLMGGLAQSSEWLLIARAVQGMAAAVAAPSTLALLMQTFQEARARARAVALYSSISGAGSSFGLVLGGLLTDALSGAGGCSSTCPLASRWSLLAPRYLPETERRPGRFDLTGAATSTLGHDGAGLRVRTRRLRRLGANAGPWCRSSRGAAARSVRHDRNACRAADHPVAPFRRPVTGRGVRHAAVHRRWDVLVLLLHQPVPAGDSGLQRAQGRPGLSAHDPLLFAMVQVVPKFSARISSAQLIAGGVLIALVGMAWLSRTRWAPSTSRRSSCPWSC